MKAKKWASKILSICLILILISCIGASLLQTDFGKVEVTEFSIPTDNGKWISGTLFRPKVASAENKVPLVITSHGYLNNNEIIPTRFTHGSIFPITAQDTWLSSSPPLFRWITPSL